MSSDLTFPRPSWPGHDPVKRAAARVGRSLGKGQAEQDRLEVKLREKLDGLDDHALELWSRVIMLDPRWCGATGQGGFWAAASDATNRIARQLLAERRGRRLVAGGESGVIHADCLAVLPALDANSVDLVVTSPPYDGLREYHGYSLDLPAVGAALYRVMRDGGVVCLVMQDQTIDGRKSMSTFRTICDWVDRVGFGLFETCVYFRHGKDGGWWARRFRVDHEYIAMFVKGDRPRVFNKDAMRQLASKHAGKTVHGSNRNSDGRTVGFSAVTINAMKCIGTVWDISNGGDKNTLKHQHPAVYPDRLPQLCIEAFTERGDTVLDPFSGSGSTVYVARHLGRTGIGIDISAEYCALARRRLAETADLLTDAA